MNLHQWARPCAGLWLALATWLPAGELTASEFTFRQTTANWQQVEKTASLVLGLERETFEPADGSGRWVIALQTGVPGRSAIGVEARWNLTRPGEEGLVASGHGSLESGMLVVDFPLRGLKPGRYTLSAEAMRNGTPFLSERRDFAIRLDAAPAPSVGARIPLIFPSGIPSTPGGYPVELGIPIPRGLVRSVEEIRLVDAEGKAHPAQLTIRARWGHEADAPIRWLGVAFTAPELPAWWPERKETPFYIEVGKPSATPPQAKAQLRIQQSEKGLSISTGPLEATINAQHFNLLENVRLNGRPALEQGGSGGAYLIDHEGATYRAANDREVKLVIEEEGPERVVIRAEGWYVKEGTTGEHQSYQLPTDRLCRFITRLEFTAGQTSVRVQHTWINTSDSYTVFFKDLGLSLHHPGAVARFGVEGAAPLRAEVGPEGVSLLQHLPDRFDLRRGGTGPLLAEGKRSSGTVLLSGSDGSRLLAVGHRETWQRFPKEIEALPGELRFHIWPRHGREHPEINPTAPERLHQHWSLHQGKLLDFRIPWENLFAVFKLTDNPKTGIYAPGGTAAGGVHSSAMGIAITSELLLHFGESEADAWKEADAFQRRPLALPHPDWVAASGVLGPFHPYAPEKYPTLEAAARQALVALWQRQEDTGEFGMFIYRGWHHGSWFKKGFWFPYRLYSAGHHQEPYLPWLYLLRSGDPIWAEMGLATIRHMTDFCLIHHADASYPHLEFHFRQGRVLGSTRHTNGFVYWGGDHATLAHLTSYGGILLAHYLTGDPRLRDSVLLWQQSLLEDRANPEAARAIRFGPGRDNNNSLGELLELYQFTHDPRLLALIQPRVDIMKDHQRTWGFSAASTLPYRRHPEMEQRLLEAAETRRAGGKADPYVVFGGYNKAETFAQAARLDPSRALIHDAASELHRQQLPRLAHSFAHPGENTPAAWLLPDNFLYLPFIMQVAADAGAAPLLENPFLPLNIGIKPKRPARVIFRKEAGEDRPITLTFARAGTPREMALTVVHESGEVVYKGRLPAKSHASVILPPDGRAGDYLLFLDVDGNDALFTPVSDLPKEVYPADYWLYPTGSSGRFYLGAANRPEERLGLGRFKGSAQIHTMDGRELASYDGLHTVEEATPLETPLPEGGAWLTTRTRSLTVNETPGAAEPLILSRSPEAFFTPGPATLQLYRTFEPFAK